MNARNDDRIWMYLGVALLAAAFAFALPGTVTASQCTSEPCTYWGWLGAYPGECGESGGGPEPDCSCWSEGEYQEQESCNGPIDP